jgi:hypothetical protein
MKLIIILSLLLLNITVTAQKRQIKSGYLLDSISKKFHPCICVETYVSIYHPVSIVYYWRPDVTDSSSGMYIHEEAGYNGDARIMLGRKYEGDSIVTHGFVLLDLLYKTDYYLPPTNKKYKFGKKYIAGKNEFFVTEIYVQSFK